MKAVNTYLNFNGNTEEAFNFYKSVFGGEFTTLMRYRETPGSDQFPNAALNKIMHVALPIGGSAVLMGTDALQSMGFTLVTGNNVHIVLYAESKEEADSLFGKLSAGGKVKMPLSDQFWGDYYGDFTDKFGICWMIIFSKNR